jgi:putative PIN family toxin of toxin-antitoxin system
MRAVLDTNIIVSGVIKEEGPSGKILRFLLQERKFISVTSLEILAEIREVLRREKIRKYHGWTHEQVDMFVAVLYAQSVVTEGELTVSIVSRDPEDNKFLACAQEGKADYLVTGDDDLLNIKSHEGTLIVPPAAFLSVLQSP